MSAPDYRSISILTEHFGYPPIALIDDVINAVNEIMYKCTQAIETYLNDRETKLKEQFRKNTDNDEDVVMADESLQLNLLPEDEIELGTAKLETLLESSVDKNFDKFELYALRNILNIPGSLANTGFVRLVHHKGLDFTQQAQTKSRDLDKKIEQLTKQINMELSLRKLLKLQILKATKLIKLLEVYKNSLQFLSTTNNEVLSAEALNSLKSIAPLDETLYFLLTQVNDLYQQVDKIRAKFDKDLAQGGVKNLKFAPGNRDKYIEDKSYKLLEKMQLLDKKDTSQLHPRADEEISLIQQMSRTLDQIE